MPCRRWWSCPGHCHDGFGRLAIFTIKFWTVLWYVAMWVAQNLIMSIYPDVKVSLQIFANPDEHDVKRMLNMITTSLYLQHRRRNSLTRCIPGAGFTLHLTT